MGAIEGENLGGVPAHISPDQRRLARRKFVVRLMREPGVSIAEARRDKLSRIRNREANERQQS